LRETGKTVHNLLPHETGGNTVSESTIPEAWVRIPTESEVRAKLPAGRKTGPYDFGFVPAMGRLLSSHARIGPEFINLYKEIMFAPGQLSRQEREMIAAVAAAAQDCHY
jgi:hypothetical protein